jgi:transposase
MFPVRLPIPAALVRGVGDVLATRPTANPRKGLRKKLPQLQLALEGRIRDHDRFLLRQLFEKLTSTEEKISQLEERIQASMHPYQHVITLWTSMAGIRETTAWSLGAEIGTSPEQFTQGHNLASWAGMCPGNNEAQASESVGRPARGIAGSAEL